MCFGIVVSFSFSFFFLREMCCMNCVENRFTWPANERRNSMYEKVLTRSGITFKFVVKKEKKNPAKESAKNRTRMRKETEWKKRANKLSLANDLHLSLFFIKTMNRIFMNWFELRVPVRWFAIKFFAGNFTRIFTIFPFRSISFRFISFSNSFSVLTFKAKFKTVFMKSRKTNEPSRTIAEQKGRHSDSQLQFK